MADDTFLAITLLPRLMVNAVSSLSEVSDRHETSMPFFVLTATGARPSRSVTCCADADSDVSMHNRNKLFFVMSVGLSFVVMAESNSQLCCHKSEVVSFAHWLVVGTQF